MSVTIYVPNDSAAIGVGANDTAQAIARIAAERGIPIRLVRNGSRGLFWLEPLVEVVTAGGRIGYGPVEAHDVASLFDAGFLQGGGHRLRVGLIDPLSIADYEAHGGGRGLRAALQAQPAGLVEEITTSGLRGRGGAAFPAGIKWKTVLNAPAGQKYVVCNADEGDSGTFSDRMILEGDPFTLIEGMAIAGVAVGATEGYIYLRSEYPHAEGILKAALRNAEAAGYLGENLLGSGRRFRLHLRRGAGAYICGEETAMLESLEGKRGMVRPKPPIPALSGLWGRPTL
ncbi:MAG: formate dehydrogenase, partial [Verrucomicrobiota bacterium]